jgi:hypothetical protein
MNASRSIVLVARPWARCWMAVGLLPVFAASARAQPVPGATLWLRADSLTGVSSGAGIATWTDSSGAGNAATQTTAGSRPTYQTGQLNGKPVVRFNGSTQFMNLPDPFAAGFSGSNTPISVYVVAKTTNTTGYQNVLFLGGNQTASAGNNDFITAQLTGNANPSVATNQFRFEVRDYNFGPPNSFTTKETTIGGTGTPVGTNFFLGTATRTSVGNVWVNGTLVSPVNADLNLPSLDLTQGSIGARKAGTIPTVDSYLTGDIAEVVVFPSVLNRAQQTVQENYLGAKYGISLAGSVEEYTALNVGYREDVIGIGKAPGGSTATSSILGGLAFAGTLAGAADDSWLFAGNTGLPNSLVSTSLPAGVSERWSRVWNVAEIGAVDAATLSFAWDAGGVGDDFDPLATYALLYSATPDPTAFSMLVGQQTALDAGAKTVSFALGAQDLASGFYTVAIVPEPGLWALLAGGVVAWAALGRRTLRRQPSWRHSIGGA